MKHSESVSAQRIKLSGVKPVLFKRYFFLLALTTTMAFAGPASAQLLINEIIQNPSAVSDANGEWFEVFNPTGSAIDIDGWTIIDNDIDSHVITNGNPLLVPAGGYIVLGMNADSSTNGGVIMDYQYSSLFLGNNADELVLLDDSLTEIDRVEWDAGNTFPNPSGASMSLFDPALDNNTGANWCIASTPFGAGDLGTPGAANDCGDPPPQPDALIINELQADPDGSIAGDANGDGVRDGSQDEFVELVNTSGGELDISGWTLSDAVAVRHTFPAGTTIAADCSIVIFGGGLPAGTFGNSAVQIASGGFLGLNNSGDTVTISNSGGDVVFYSYGSEGGNDQSVTRDPDITGSDPLVAHSTAVGSGGRLFSPGTQIDGSNFSGCTSPEGSDSLVINEIDYDQAGTDAAEFLEIKNVGDSTVRLNTWSVQFINGNNNSIYQNFALPAVDLSAGDFYVICGDAANVYGCDLDVSPNSNLIQNGAPDAVALLLDGVIVDTVSYEGSVPGYTETSGDGLSDSSSAPFLGISRYPDGEDSNVNNVDFSRHCVSPGSVNLAAEADCEDPRPPLLLINEIDYDQPGSDTAEFVEIINAGNSTADLSGVDLMLVNGNGASAYNTIALPATSLAAGDYFVVCANAATVANCDLDASPDSNLVQNGAPDAVALMRAGVILDTVSYEGSTAAPWTEGSGDGLFDSGSSGQDNRGISRFPNGTDTGHNNSDLVNACITPGLANSELTANCGGLGPVLEIYQIQGNGPASPFAGQGVSTEDNIVTALGPEGFFIQTPNARDDADIDTSNGIYVFSGGAPLVAVGDQVDVAGAVQEFFGFTEMSSAVVSVDSSGHALPAITTFDSTVPSPDPAAPSCAIEYECYEGMLVEIAGGAVTGPNQRFGSDPVAEVHITAAPVRTFREPGIEYPGLPGFAVWDGNPEVFELDPDKLGLPNVMIPAGSHFDAIGTIGYEFGGYEFWPTELSVSAASLPAPVRARSEMEMTIGSLNLFRLFDDIDNGGETVLDSTEYARRLSKFSDYIRNVLDSPDILAVQEVERLEVLEDLAAVIFADDPAVGYSAVLEEGNDVGGIDVGFLVRRHIAVDAVTQLGKDEILDFDGSLLNDRPPLLLEARCTLDGSDFPVSVMAIHSRSLGGIEDSGNNGERVRQKRLEQAEFVANEAQALQEANPLVNLIIIGDFNAFEFSDAYVDVSGHMKGDFSAAENLVCDSNTCDDLVNPDLIDQALVIPEDERYTFIFSGNAQVLDHALTNNAMDQLIRDFVIGRGNSDAAVDLINTDSTPLRSSDHDGIVLYVAKDNDGDGVGEDVDMCPGTSIPESVPTNELRTNNFALSDSDREFDTKAPKGQGPEANFSTFDTGGCSCEQIIDIQGLGNGHRKFGCSLGVMRGWVEALNRP